MMLFKSYDKILSNWRKRDFDESMWWAKIRAIAYDNGEVCGFSEYNVLRLRVEWNNEIVDLAKKIFPGGRSKINDFFSIINRIDFQSKIKVVDFLFPSLMAKK